MQHVSTVAARKIVIAWMIKDEALHGVQGLPVCTIRAFPEQFYGQKSANYMKATCWWKLRDQFFNDLGQQNINVTLSCSKSRLGHRKRLFTKAGVGRGQIRSEWVQWLYPRLLDAFQGFKRTGVKFSSKLLIELALSILLAPDSMYTIHSREAKDNRLLTEKICHSWIQ